MKKICWITNDPFVDCEWVPIDVVSRYYLIEWIVLLPSVKPRYVESEFSQFVAEHPNVIINFFYFRRRLRDPRRIVENFRLGQLALKSEADIYYINSGPGPWSCATWWQLPKGKKIVTSHQGSVHVGMGHKKIIGLSRWLVYHNAPIVNMFSISQAKQFESYYKKTKVEVIPLALKDYGLPTVPEANGQDDCVVFLLFGIINYAKNVDLLIDAACNLYEHGTRGFKVRICGGCKSWEFYQKRIRVPEIFENSIGFISNEKIPNLVAGAHYFVQPYRVVSQSGAMKVAFQYNTPVIVSNLSGFTDEVCEGVNGYSFIQGDVDDLERVMKNRVDNFHSEYDSLRQKMKVYTAENYSSEKIGAKYLEMFNKVV